MKTKQTEFLELLEALPEDERCAAAVEANCWQWPKALEQYKEAHFDGMSNSQKMTDPTWEAAWGAIHQCTSAFGRSQAWWMIRLKRTREAHAAWWANGRKPLHTDTANFL